MQADRPSEAVLRAFGAGTAERLTGGQGGSWRADDVVFKYGLGQAEVEWLHSLPLTTSVRTARPVRAADGRLIVEGWSAVPYLAGGHVAGRWHDIAQAGRDLAMEFADIAPPPWAAARADPWAIADRIAWEEEELPRVAPSWLRGLADRRRHLEAPRTLIHGDLTGNVLFHPGLPPAAIDFSAYFRPVEYATAIVVVDAVCFEGAPPRTRALVIDAEAGQLLVRRILFRAVTDLLRTGGVDERRYSPATALLGIDR